MSEKTEKPTSKRLRDAREKGQAAKSKEIATCAGIVGMFGYLWIFGDGYFDHIIRIFAMPASYYRVVFEEAYVQCIKGVVKELMLLSIPFAITAMVIVVLSYLLQFGVLFAFESILPDFKKINPVEGVKRIFSLNNLLELIKSILKIVLLGTVIYLLVKSHINCLLHVPRSGIQEVFSVIGVILKKLILYVSCFFIILAILDYFFQKHLYIKKLKMSKDDLKQEHKDREGNPQVKGNRRKIHRGLINSDILGKIQRSTIIITYSNKIAVALYYQYGQTKLPVIFVKGQNLLSEKMIDLAGKFSVPIFQDPYLARKLFEKGKENQYIPHDLVKPIAMVMRSVMRKAKV